jgi:hypothetical protein
LRDLATSLDALIDDAAQVAVRKHLRLEIERLLANDPSQLVTTTQLADLCPAYTVGALTKLAERARRNGLTEARALSRCGKKLLWNKRRFMEWAEGK